MQVCGFCSIAKADVDIEITCSGGIRANVCDECWGPAIDEMLSLGYEPVTRAL